MKAMVPRQLLSVKYSISIALLLIIGCGVAQAKVVGPCSSCHTMHNSENGSILIANGSNQALLRLDCVGCHTGDNELDNGASVTNGTPFINYTDNVDHYGEAGILGRTLAGGTFHFINDSPAAGHNVLGIDNTDTSVGTTPPGYLEGLPDKAGHIPGGGDWSEKKITCAGTYGCHGNHNTENQFFAVRGAHHQGINGGKIEPGTNTSPAAGYRMLVGIAGFEDSDWEYLPKSDSHNQYKGSTTPGEVASRDSISYLCAQCHGQFHSPAENITLSGGSPWLRHPTEYAMKTTGEYANYSEYLPATPLASSDISAVISTVNSADNRIVNCLSCHRAHGSPYYKLMRWDYANDSSGGLCVNCHSSKN